MIDLDLADIDDETRDQLYGIIAGAMESMVTGRPPEETIKDEGVDLDSFIETHYAANTPYNTEEAVDQFKQAMEQQFEPYSDGEATVFKQVYWPEEDSKALEQAIIDEDTDEYDVVVDIHNGQTAPGEEPGTARIEAYIAPTASPDEARAYAVREDPVLDLTGSQEQYTNGVLVDNDPGEEIFEMITDADSAIDRAVAERDRDAIGAFMDILLEEFDR